ncbi:MULTISPECIES: universal stress protein [unclassified Streptomyces]|uniref:universal stress protein n=1 Tax=unclassified Streptomyces TaxID=2593676 RepID=UPI0034217933
MVRHVTAGVDETDESLAAAHWAAREALRRGAALRLVHAGEWPVSPAPSAAEEPGPRDWAEQTLERAVRSVRAAHPGLPVEDQLVPDSPVTVLLGEAEGAELLVLGSRGLGRAAGFVMGSVSQRVVARSPGPVVLVRALEACTDEHLPALDGVSPEEIPETPYRDVVLGMDTRQPCDELIAFAFDAARRRGASLRVVHALGAALDNAAEGRSGAGHDTELLADEEDLMAAMLRPWAEKCPGVTMSETVTAGRPAAELVRESAHASLVVVGRRTRDTRLCTQLGSVTHALLHHARCPVAVVPHS